MSLFYRILYAIGIRPWEEMATLPISKQIAALFDREQEGLEAPLGRALDIGCGSGIWATDLAARGWDVTGVDIVPKALATARRRAADAGVLARFVEADLTALRAAGVGSGFRLLVDFGSIHGLDDAQRTAAGSEITAVAAPGATLLILAWVPARRGPLPRGMSAPQIHAMLPDWSAIDETPADISGAPAFVRNAQPRFYRMRYVPAA